MWKYFLVLAVLILTPLGLFLNWLAGLPTEREVHARNRPELEARLAQIKKTLATLPPPGSVTARTLPSRPDPAPVCDAATGACNLQRASTSQLEDLKRYADQNSSLKKFGPHSLADILLYDVTATLAPHERVGQKVLGFAALIETGLRSRYLLIDRHLHRPDPKGELETTGVEGFLIDLQADKVVGAFRYPDEFRTAGDDPTRKNTFLTETLGGRFAPQFKPGRNVRTGDVEVVTFAVLAYEVAMVAVLLASIPTAVMVKRQWRRVEAMKEDGVYPDFLRCPVCEERTDSLKQYRMLRVGFFIGIAGGGHMETVTACPRCMRRHVGKRFAVNLIPANLLMLGFGPAYAFSFLRTFGRGHSPAAVEEAESETVSRKRRFSR